MIARRRPDLATFERRTSCPKATNSQQRRTPSRIRRASPFLPLWTGSSGKRSDCHRGFAGQPIESFYSSCKLVCLSASLRWAWLQGNSRARQLRSPVPALPGFGFPCRLPAAPFERHKQSALDPPKNRFPCFESRPLRTGRPNESGHERKTKHALHKESHHPHWFSRPKC